MDTIIQAIDEEIQRLQQVRQLLSQNSGAAESTRATAGTKAAKTRGGKRKLSPEARKRIADAQKKRWAAQKKGEGGIRR